MPNLYNLNQFFLSMLEKLDENGGELTPELEEEFNEQLKDFESAFANCIFSIRATESDLGVIEKEIERLKAKAAAREKTIARLKDMAMVAMDLRGIDKVKDPLFTAYKQAATSVLVTNVHSLPEDCLRIVPEKTEPDKKRIKEVIESGIDVPGAELVTNNSLRIK